MLASKRQESFMGSRRAQSTQSGGASACHRLCRALAGTSQVAPRPAPTGRAPGSTGRAADWLARCRWTTWQPRRRTHLLCVGLTGLLVLVSLMGLYPWTYGGVLGVLLGGLGVSLVSLWPLVGAVLALGTSALDLWVTGGPTTPVLPLVGPWLCAAVLLTRGFHRSTAYGVAALNALLLAWTLWGQQPPETSPTEIVQVAVVVAGMCLVVAELVRQPRAQTEENARRHQADLERQRLLVVSELHDTVVRDLTQAVMVAEQARLSSRPGDSLAADLAAMTASVRTAVEQLRGSLRTLGEAGAAHGTPGGAPGRAPAAAPGQARTLAPLDVLASAAPRPLGQSVAAARELLAARGITLEARGLEVLDRPEIGPGLRQQLTRVLNELVANLAKYAGPGSARLLVECDGQSVEALVSNATAAGAEAGAAASSGLGLVGARRRVEAVGGRLDVSPGQERFTVVLSVPLTAGGPAR